jgi:hypothetical protein
MDGNPHKLRKTGIIGLRVCAILAALIGLAPVSHPQETAKQFNERKAIEAYKAYDKSPYSILSKDYFSRFNRNPDTKAAKDEVLLTDGWKIVISDQAKTSSKLMAGYLAEFLSSRMNVRVAVVNAKPDSLKKEAKRTILLSESRGGGEKPESFTIIIERERAGVYGKDVGGLRDGIVNLVDQMGFRRASILKIGRQTYEPRLALRAGTVPWLGSYRDVVFAGNNAVVLCGSFSGGVFREIPSNNFSLFNLSTSDVIPELNTRRDPDALKRLSQYAKDAKLLGLKCFLALNTRPRFSENDPVFTNHPDTRGAPMKGRPGEFNLCTETPLVRLFLTDSIKGLLRAVPELDGIQIIVGGEGFHHCFLNTEGSGKGHTVCLRCEALGAETVVANLCNYLAEAAREVNPAAVVFAWPYSAKIAWSEDYAQIAFIDKLHSGVELFTEIEKDEYLDKPEGIRKAIWDYSIDLIGPGQKAKQQIAAGQRNNLKVHLKSEPELAFEAPRLPYIPCLDRWAARAEALASSGADGAWVFAYFRPYYGNTSAEINKFFWWTPVPAQEELLQRLAVRIGGSKAAPHLRKAWKFVSQAIDFSPEMPSYFIGPTYFGPAHLMFADPNTPTPDLFQSPNPFYEIGSENKPIDKRQAFIREPRGNSLLFEKYYSRMEERLSNAKDEIDQAQESIPLSHRLVFDAEALPVRWFWHTIRSTVNFYKSCRLRDAMLKLAAKPSRTADDAVEAKSIYDKWRSILLDEKANAEAALPVMAADMRLDFYYGYSGGKSHSFFHGADMIKAKLAVLDGEINAFLPSLLKQCEVRGVPRPVKIP